MVILQIKTALQYVFHIRESDVSLIHLLTITCQKQCRRQNQQKQKDESWKHPHDDVFLSLIPI